MLWNYSFNQAFVEKFTFNIFIRRVFLRNVMHFWNLKTFFSISSKYLFILIGWICYSYFQVVLFEKIEYSFLLSFSITCLYVICSKCSWEDYLWILNILGRYNKFVFFLQNLVELHIQMVYIRCIFIKFNQ